MGFKLYVYILVWSECLFNYIIYCLVVGLFALTTSSCEDDPPACELQNTGTFVVENGHPEGSLEVHFNKARVAGNSQGDLSLEPGESGSMQLPAGSHKVVAILIISPCTGDRCQVQSSSQNNSQEDLSACETRNFIF